MGKAKNKHWKCPIDGYSNSPRKKRCICGYVRGTDASKFRRKLKKQNEQPLGTLLQRTYEEMQK